MNGNNGGILHQDVLRERKKPTRDELVRENNAAENMLLADNHDQKTFGKTPDGAGELSYQ